MKLDEIMQKAGRHKSRKRIGRGIGSGHGKTSGRGHNGMGSRAGSKRRLGYEGGQTPIIARSPKRGFSNFQFRKPSQIINIADFEQFEDGTRVDAAMLSELRLIDDPAVSLKVLGNGELTKKLTVVAAKFSAKAAEKIQAAGGSCEQA